MDSHQQQCAGLYCPGSLTEPRHRPQTGVYRAPTYVAGNLRIPSKLPLTIPHHHRPHGTRTKPKTALPPRFSSCFDNFAIAKKFHTENLQHQPLPDRVDDRVFMNTRLERAKSLDSLTYSSSQPGERHVRTLEYFHRGTKKKKSFQYGPVLGCKNPETHMDLAICWDAPIDPNYEPRRPVHIDGTDGGPGPAIFTLVQHPHHSGIANNECLRPACPKNDDYGDPRLDHRNQHHHQAHELNTTAVTAVDDDYVTRNNTKFLTKFKTQQEEDDDVAEHENNLRKSLCNEFNDIRITSEEERGLAKRHTRSADQLGTIRKHASYLRNCSACDQAKLEVNDSRRTEQLAACPSGSRRDGNRNRNGLSSAANIPRPRTPYAKRSFCIDTLTPPFSIVNGCRDADYPEHWRLTSVYQQSYKPPRKQRGTILSYIHH